VRDTGKISEFINNIKKIPNNINSFTPIYSDTDTEIGTINFSEIYKILTERAGRKTVTDIKNSARS
jgi:hypothetical protein